MMNWNAYLEHMETVTSVWYALQNSSEDAWDDGTENREEAIERMMNSEEYNLIAVIDDEEKMCIGEIRKDGDDYYFVQ